MVDVGTAVAKLTLDASQFQTNLSTSLSSLERSVGDTQKNISQKLNGIGNSLKGTGTALTTGITLPVVALGTKAVKSFSDFEYAMSEVKAISGATGDEFEQLREKAEYMGATTSWTATQAAEALKYMGMAGWEPAEMLVGLEHVMNLATAAGEDLGTTSDIVTDALTAFGLEAKDTEHFTDLLAQTSRTSNTNVSMLGESFKFVAPVVGSLGMSADDAAIALGLMANAGIKSSMAGTSLRSVLTRMAKPTNESAEAMEILGISLEDDAGNMYTLREIMDKLRQSFGKGTGDVNKFNTGLAELDAQYQAGEISEEEYEQAIEDLTISLYGAEGAEKAKLAAMLAGKTGMSGLLAIVNASEEDYRALTAAIDGCTGATTEMKDEMLNTTKGSMDLMNSAIDALFRSFGELLAPVIRDIAQKVQELANKFNGLTDAQKQQIVKWAALAAAIGPCLIVLGSVVSSVGNILSVFGKIGSVFTGVVNHFKNVGSSASTLGGNLKTASTAASTATGTFGTFAGQALKLAAVAVVILAAAEAVKILADSAIALYQAGPGAIATFGGLTVAALAMTAGIAAIGSVCTATAVGLLALGAAVLLVSAGIALITDAVAALVRAFADLIESFVPLADKMPIIAEYGLQAAAGITAIGAACMLAAVPIIATDTALAGYIITAGLAVPITATLSVAIAALDVVLVGLAASMELCGITFKNTWETIANTIQYATTTILNAITNFVDGIIELFKHLKYVLIGDPIVFDLTNGIIGAFIEMVKNVIDSIKKFVEKIIQSFKDLWNNIKNWLSDVKQKVTSWLSEMIEKVTSWFKDIISKISKWLSEIIDSVVKWFGKVVSTVTEWLGNVLKKFTSWFDDFKTKMKQWGEKAISSLWDGIKSVWTKVASWFEEKFKWIGDMASKMIQKVRDITSSLSFNGSHATGLDYVPFDGYVAQLHKGERVLTKTEAKEYDKGGTQSGGDTYNFYNTKPDPYEYSRQMKQAKRELLFD